MNPIKMFQKCAYSTALWYPANVLFQIKILKSRLRSLIGEELLESLLLCSVEFDLLKAIDNDTVYRNFH